MKLARALSREAAAKEAEDKALAKLKEATEAPFEDMSTEWGADPSL